MSDDSEPSIGKRIRHYNELEAQFDALKAEYAALRTNRWAAFTDDELENLAIATERGAEGDGEVHSPTLRTVRSEIQAEIERRKA